MKKRTLEKYFVAVCQMDSQNDKYRNLEDAKRMLCEAVEKGADIVVFPENMNFMGKGYRYQAEPIPGPTTDFLSALAKEHDIWILSGSIPEIEQNDPAEQEPTSADKDAGEQKPESAEKNAGLQKPVSADMDAGKPKPKNSLVLIDPAGEIRCKYSKLHLFDVDLKDGNSFRESHSVTPGEDIVLCDTELGRLGFTICYDLRFGELYRLLSLSGAQVIFVPACFAMQTGRAHWEVLLRARAIENGVYIVACNQIGEKYNMTAYGHSMVIDPWGKVIARAEDKPCVLMAEIDLERIDEVRSQIPSLLNRRADLYELREMKGSCQGRIGFRESE